MEQIEAFLEAARGPSFRAAAERCALSPAAFTRRIQAFSSHVGVPLFVRDGTRLRLSRTGLECLKELEPAYLALRRAAADVASRDPAGARVTVSLSHSLAVGWLIPRLEEFSAAHPGISVELVTRRDASALRRGDADIGICFSDVDLSGFACERLFGIVAAPVAAPSVVARCSRSAHPLSGLSLLSVTWPPDIWNQWSERTGRNDALATPARFEMLQAMYESAACGQGIAIGASPTVWPYLHSGRLVRLPLPAARLRGGYRIASTHSRKRPRSIDTVWRWLRSEAQKTPDLSPVAAA
jgi:DNA-binding transcriptional LysR family regulator